METIITPGFLKKGDAIGIIAPSRKIEETDLVPFTHLMKQQGYKVLYGKHLFMQDRQFSGSIEQRLSDFQEMLLNTEVKAIFAARGGYGAGQLLSGIDWEVLRENPKWLIGFSDITALHAAIGKFMKTMHAVMPYSLLMDEPQDGESFSRLLDLLAGKKTQYSAGEHALNVPGQARGVLVGGNLSVLYSMAGTPYEPDYEGKILFLEDLDEYLYHIDRMILNFELRDIFNKISGLIIGDFSDMHDNTISFGKTAYEIIAERAIKYGVPTLFGFPAGHKKMNLPLIFGGVSTLTVKEGENSLKMY